MFEFLVGYALGANAGERRRVSAKSVAVFLLVLITLAGTGWLMVAAMSDTQPVECGGTAMVVAMCKLQASAKTIGILLLGVAFSAAAIWVAIISVFRK
jgi:hypothetical protein